jgi:hypothetical protein
LSARTASVAVKRSLVFLSLVCGLNVGCAAHADEDSDTGTGAATTGSGLHTPMKPGLYDSKGGMMYLYTSTRDLTSIGAQLGNFELSLGDGNSAGCDATVDVTDGVASFTDVSCRTTLDKGAKAVAGQMLVTVSDTGTEMDISGVIAGKKFNEHFAPRKAGALNGTYTASGGEKFVVSASSATELSFHYKLQVGDKSYEGEARSAENDDKTRPGRSAALFNDNVLGNCKVSFSPTRAAGKTTWTTYAIGVNADTVECKALGLHWE